MVEWQWHVVARLPELRGDEPGERVRLPVRSRCLLGLRVDVRRVQ